jgi:hypothetical protein
MQTVCMREDDPQKKCAKVCKKSAFHKKVCKSLQKSPRRRLCRLMQTFEKVCTSLPPDEYVIFCTSTIPQTVNSCFLGMQ